MTDVQDTPNTSGLEALQSLVGAPAEAPIVYEQKLDAQGRAYANGKRDALARVC